MVETNKQKTNNEKTLPIHRSSSGNEVKDKDIWNNTRPITVKGKCLERNNHNFFILRILILLRSQHEDEDETTNSEKDTA